MFDWHIAQRLTGIEKSLAEIQRSLAALHRSTRKIGEMEMASLQQVLDEVNSESSQIDSLNTLIAGLRQQVQDATSGASLPPAVQNQIDQVFARAQANTQKIAAALNANTPAQTVDPSASATDGDKPKASDQSANQSTQATSGDASSGQGGASGTSGQTG